jgi:uncharacterized protein
MRLIFVFFLVTLALSLFILNWFLYYPIVKAFKLKKKQRLMLLLTLLLMTLMMVWGETVRRIWGISEFSLPGQIWLGILAISFTVMSLNLILRVLSLLAPRIIIKQYCHELLSRLFRHLTTLSIVLVILLSAIALRNNYLPAIVQHHSIYSDKITPNTEGLKVVLVSEFHFMNNTSIDRLNRIISQINQLDPDMVIIAGDLIDDNISRIWHLAPFFRNINAKYGKYVIPGNHDYYNDLQNFIEFVELAGLTPLYNEWNEIIPGLVLSGITDPQAGRFGYDSPDVSKALAGVDENDFIILASHQPLYTEEALSGGADLILAGHTHGGQIPPMTFLVSLRFKYHYGLFNKEDQRYVYTTSGVNIWGPPMRLGTSNEIVLFELKRTD